MAEAQSGDARGKERPLSMRSERGAAAEAIVAAALTARGWRIVARNRRVAGLEIDLLALDPAGSFVAVEVRRRIALGNSGPRELLGTRKLAALQRQREALSALERVDLVFVLGRLGGERIRLWRGIA